MECSVCTSYAHNTKRFSRDMEDGLKIRGDSLVFMLKIFCFQFKGWNQPYNQPVLKFPPFLPADQLEKSAGISKLVDDKAGSIL